MFEFEASLVTTQEIQEIQCDVQSLKACRGKGAGEGCAVLGRSWGLLNGGFPKLGVPFWGSP